jgi:ribosomal protein S27AE
MEPVYLDIKAKLKNEGDKEFVELGLWVECPKCGADKLVAVWKDLGGVQLGSLSCGECKTDDKPTPLFTK